MEEVRYDDDGNPITSNLADYAFISAAELPSFELVPMETPTFINPLGAKGIGESGTIGSTPAIQSAVVDAVSHLGVRHIDMPTTAERVWQAIQAAEQLTSTRRLARYRRRLTDGWSTRRTGGSVNRRTHVLVDLDGTITDSFPAITGSLKLALRRARPAGPAGRGAAGGRRAAVRARPAADRRARRPAVGRHRPLPRALRGRRAVRVRALRRRRRDARRRSLAAGIVLCAGDGQAGGRRRCASSSTSGSPTASPCSPGRRYEPGRRTKDEVITHALARARHRRPAPTS